MSPDPDPESFGIGIGGGIEGASMNAQRYYNAWPHSPFVIL